MNASSSFLGFDLLRSEFAPFALCALVLLAVGFYGLIARQREREQLVSGSQIKRFLPGYSNNRARLRVILAAVGCLFLCLSLLGPVRGYTKREVRRSGLDIVVCIDTSRSMLSRDVRDSRLGRAKREVLGLLDRLASDRVALVGFSGDARQVAPLTHDRTTLAALLESVSPLDNRKGGTDLGVAIERALQLFDGRSGNHEAIVLLTDGEDLEGNGLKRAKQAAEQGIRVYVIGVGTTEGGKIPVELADGTEGFMQDARGTEIVTRLDSSTLEVLAKATGGLYLSTEQSPTPLEYIYDRSISKMDRRDLDGGIERVPHDRFQWTLVLALACMVFEVGLRERRVRSREVTL
ncbi:MAG: Ca-activated chloride channel family protein [Planctomycetota bacterium]|jgi:Ca-activated chloride channel family protein